MGKGVCERGVVMREEFEKKGEENGIGRGGSDCFGRKDRWFLVDRDEWCR